MEYSSNGKGNLGVTLGAIGTAGTVLGAMGNGNGGLLNIFGRNDYMVDSRYITKEDLNMSMALAAKDSEIALLKSEQNTEVKIADVYERIMTRVNADARAQADVNAAQAVFNATSNAAVAVLQNQVAVLNGLTKTIVPADNVCPKPMPQFNSWTAPTT